MDGWMGVMGAVKAGKVKGDVFCRRFNKRAVKVGSYRNSGLYHVQTDIVFVLPTSGKRTAVVVLYETETLVRVQDVWRLQTPVSSTQSRQLNHREDEDASPLECFCRGRRACIDAARWASCFPTEFSHCS